MTWSTSQLIDFGIGQTTQDQYFEFHVKLTSKYSPAIKAVLWASSFILGQWRGPEYLESLFLNRHISGLSKVIFV